MISDLRFAIIFAASTVLSAGTTSAQISRLPDNLTTQLPANNQRRTFELFAPLLQAAPKEGVTVTRDEAYGSDPLQRLDVYHPAAGSSLPVFVYVHGGVLVAGDKNETNEISANVLYYFARKVGSTARLDPD